MRAEPIKAHIKATPLKEHIGANVEVDRDRLGDPEVGRQCMELLDKYHVLVFPRINLTDEEQLTFTDSLGKRLNFSKKVDGGKGGTPDVYRVTLNSKINRQQEYIKGTYFWHMDGMTVPEQPPKATLLNGRIITDKGGDTHFCSTYAGYEFLDDDMKKEIENLRVVHSLTPYLSSIMEEPTADELARWNSQPINEWPLVWKHNTGQRSLVMGATCHHIKGMDLASGKALIARLMEWTAQPNFTYIHKWQQGDLVIWNNYGVMHRVTPYPEDCGRQMHRTTLEATEYLQ
jgi:alpha-ketoglutarate-dependent taurine dioxygenase